MVIRAVEEHLGDQDVTFFHEGIAVLKHRSTECIDVKGGGGGLYQTGNVFKKTIAVILR